MKVTGSIFDRYELVLEHFSINECTNQGKKKRYLRFTMVTMKVADL
jgi:hypothetical protein